MEGRALTVQGHKGTFEGGRNVVYFDCGRCYMTVHTCQNSEDLKRVNFILCKLHFNKPDLRDEKLLDEI